MFTKCTPLSDLNRLLMKEPKFAWTDDDIVKVYNPSVTIYVDMWRRKFTDNHDSRSI